MEEIKSIPIDHLLLDKKNPRIHQTISDKINQIDLAKFIYQKFGIADLKDSIQKNGYFPVEPMVVIPSRDGFDNYIVVEGNRRLTAIKILCKQEYRDQIISLGRRDDYIADQTLIGKLKTIPVVIARDRDSVNAYLGVRHLGGVIRWEPLAQSKYVYNQIIKEKDSLESKLVNDAINKFVQETNNKKNDVLNHFYKYCIYKHMNRLIDEKLKIKPNIDNKFSLLEVAFGKSGTTSIAKYVGIESYNRLDPENYENIISEEKEKQTINLIKWIFSENPPIQESRQINKYLRPILSSPVSTEAFEQGEDKDDALLLSDSYDNIIKKSCNNIHKSLTHIQQNWEKTQTDSREELKKLYRVNVVEKVDKTNKTVDL